MMKHLSEILILILALRDWHSPVEHTSSTVSRNLVFVPIRNSTILHRRYRNQLNVNQ